MKLRKGMNANSAPNLQLKYNVFVFKSVRKYVHSCFCFELLTEFTKVTTFLYNRTFVREFFSIRQLQEVDWKRSDSEN